MAEPINFNKIKAIRINEPEREPKMSRLWHDWQNAELNKPAINPTNPSFTHPAVPIRGRLNSRDQIVRPVGLYICIAAVFQRWTYSQSLQGRTARRQDRPARCAVSQPTSESRADFGANRFVMGTHTVCSLARAVAPVSRCLHLDSLSQGRGLCS